MSEVIYGSGLASKIELCKENILDVAQIGVFFSNSPQNSDLREQTHKNPYILVYLSKSVYFPLDSLRHGLYCVHCCIPSA